MCGEISGNFFLGVGFVRRAAQPVHLKADVPNRHPNGLEFAQKWSLGTGKNQHV